VQFYFAFPANSIVPLHRTCLVVDDDSAMRRFVRTILDRQGFQILEALNGVQGLHLVEKLGDALDLIVSDIHMPNGDGLTFVSTVRQTYPTIPIVLMSGSAGSHQHIIPRPMFEFLQKPFTPAQLIEVIGRAANAGRPLLPLDGN
jgi:two-component system, cell cycle sensor histidine kinase and response regulator CckA